MRLIDITAYEACLSNEPFPFKVRINYDLISSLSPLSDQWTVVWLGGGPQTFALRGSLSEVEAELEQLASTSARPEEAKSCPSCGSSLFDAPGAVVDTNPPLHGVQCSSCSWTGYREDRPL